MDFTYQVIFVIGNRQVHKDFDVYMEAVIYLQKIYNRRALATLVEVETGKLSGESKIINGDWYLWYFPYFTGLDEDL
jgi:hypothetical protein